MLKEAGVNLSPGEASYRMYHEIYVRYRNIWILLERL